MTTEQIFFSIWLGVGSIFSILYLIAMIKEVEVSIGDIILILFNILLGGVLVMFIVAVESLDKNPLIIWKRKDKK